MDRTLPAQTLARLATALQPFESLRVNTDGSVHLVRSYQVRTVEELTIACRGYERGDHASIIRRETYWLVELSRPMSLTFDG